MQNLFPHVFLTIGERRTKLKKIICFKDGGPSGQYRLLDDITKPYIKNKLTTNKISEKA